MGGKYDRSNQSYKKIRRPYSRRSSFFPRGKGTDLRFLGPNGAGKSTTMNIITGYLAASEGTVTIDGKDVQKDPEEAKRSIGYLPELRRCMLT